jgi:Fe2+ or Zn2+ uptake regulation protein
MSKTKPQEVEGFTLQRWLTSKRFTPQQKDILNVVLQAGEAYTYEEVQQRIENFLKQEVS